MFAAALDGQAAPDLYVLDGGTTTRLTQTAGAELYPAISPDRREIAFVRDFQLFAIGADGRNERLVAPKTGRERKINDTVYSTTIGPAAWSPDGKQLAYPYPRDPRIIVDDDGNQVDQSVATTIHIINADGTGDRRVSATLDLTINSISWGPENTLAFSTADDCPDCAGSIGYAVMKTDGTGYRDLYFDGPFGPEFPTRHLDWSPDGTRWVYLAFAGYNHYDDPGVMAISTAFMHDETLLGEGWNTRWSHDASEVAFIGSDGIYIVAAMGGTPRRTLQATGIRGLDW